jgi:hypothetical protein
MVGRHSKRGENQGISPMLVVLLSVVLFAAGTGAGCLISRSTQPENRPPNTARERVRNEAADDEPTVQRPPANITIDPPIESAPSAAATPRTEPTPVAPTKPPLPALLPVESQKLADLLLKAVDLRTVPTGDGVITGRVLNLDGEPLKDVQVAAVADYSAPDDPEPVRPALLADLPIEETAAHRITSEAYRRASRRTAATGEKGLFRIEKLGQSKYTVTATLKGFDLRWRGKREAQAWPGEIVNFEAIRTSSVLLDVLKPDAAPAIGARLRIWSDAGDKTGRTEVWNHETRELLLEPGHHTLMALYGAHTEMMSQTVVLEIESGRDPPTAQLQLIDRPGLAVIPEFGDPTQWKMLRSISISYLGKPAEQPTGGYQKLATQKTTSDEIRDGQFIFVDMLPGEYTLEAWGASGMLGSGSARVAVSGLTPVTFRIPQLRAGFVAVRPVSPDNKPLSNVRYETCWVSKYYKRSDSYPVGEPAETADGTFLIPHSDAATIRRESSDAEFFIRATCDEYGTVDAYFNPPATSILIIQFSDAPRLRVFVRLPSITERAASGSMLYELSDIAVHVGALDELKTTKQFRRAGKDGALDPYGMKLFTLPRTGIKEISILARIAPDVWVVVKQQEFTVRTAGITDVWINSPPLYSMTVKFDQGSKVKGLQLTPPSLDRFPAQSAREALGDWQALKLTTTKWVMNLSFLPSGSYRLAAEIDGEPSKTMTTPLTSKSPNFDGAFQPD